MAAVSARSDGGRISTVCGLNALLPEGIRANFNSPLRRRYRTRPRRVARRHPLVRIVVGFHRRLPEENAAVEHFLVVRDGLVEQAIAGDLRHHEVVDRAADLVELALLEVVKISATAAGHEVGDALLRLDAFV